MDISQFPEHHRAYILSGVVRNNRNGISVKFGELKGSILRLIVRQQDKRSPLPAAELAARARAAFADAPYDVMIDAE